MLNWFFNLVAARTARTTKQRVNKLTRILQLEQAVYELHHARKNPTTAAQRAVLHAAGKVRAPCKVAAPAKLKVAA